MYKGHSLSNSLSLYTFPVCPGTQSRHFPVTISCSTCDLYLGNPEHTRTPNYLCAVVLALVPFPFYAAYMSCLVSQRKAQIDRLYVVLYDLLYSCVFIYFVHVIFMCVCVCVISFLYFPYFYLKIFVIFKKHHRVRRYRKGSQRLPTMLLIFSCRFLVISFKLQIFLFSEPNWVFILSTVLCYCSFRFNFVSKKH